MSYTEREQMLPFIIDKGNKVISLIAPDGMSQTVINIADLFDMIQEATAMKEDAVLFVGSVITMESTEPLVSERILKKVKDKQMALLH